jgi:5-methylcytosine-specific restriction endonuclease McrA
MAKKGRPVSLEELAARMTRSMNRPARCRKTREYIASLPPRKKVRITASDYPQPREPVRVEIEPIKRKAVVKPVPKMTPSPIIKRDGRKDRLRPRARPQPLPVEQRQTSVARWACRPNGRHRKPWARQAPKLIRTLELTMQQRFLLHVAQHGRCGLCGEPMHGTPFSLSLDHVIPRSLDGPDGLGNLLLCHGECNGAKTNDVPTGCEMVWLLAVNARLGADPVVF